MATESSNKDDNSKFRFTVDVSRRLAEEIERMAKESGRSKAEVFSLAIGLLSTARAAQNEGMRVGAWGDSSEHRQQREFVNFL